MAMTQAQVQLNNAQTAAATVLVDKETAYISAVTASRAAQTAEQTAKDALDAAWTDYVTKVGAYERSILVAPEGYTPPVPPV